MTNYNEQLDETIRKIRGDDYGPMDYGSYAEVKQAFTSLFKELVAEAKPKNNWLEDSDLFYGQDEGVSEFEQNLLKALEEV